MRLCSLLFPVERAKFVLLVKCVLNLTNTTAQKEEIISSPVLIYQNRRQDTSLPDGKLMRGDIKLAELLKLFVRKYIKWPAIYQDDMITIESINYLFI